MSLSSRVAARLSGRPVAAPVVQTAPRDRAGEPVCAVLELGSFSHGACPACGWQGPGRRARSSARKDAELHSLTGCGR